MKVEIEIPDNIVAGEVTKMLTRLIPDLQYQVGEGVKLAVIDLKLSIQNAVRDKAKQAIWVAMRDAVDRAFIGTQRKRKKKCPA